MPDSSAKGRPERGRQNMVGNSARKGVRFRHRVTQCLELVNLAADTASKYPSELSGGMRKRVGIGPRFQIRGLTLVDVTLGMHDPLKWESRAAFSCFVFPFWEYISDGGVEDNNLVCEVNQ